MALYYSGANAPGAQQPDPAKSLGGYMSSTQVPNGFLGNVFTVITKNTVANKKKEIRLIILKNFLPAIMTSVRLWTTVPVSPTGFSKLKIAAVAPAIDPKCDYQYFESVANDDAIPYQAQLDYHEGELNAIEIGDIAVGGIVGIWMQRELNLDSFTTADGLPGAPSTAIPTGSGSACSDESVALLEAQAENLLREDATQLIVDYV